VRGRIATTAAVAWLVAGAAHAAEPARAPTFGDEGWVIDDPQPEIGEQDGRSTLLLSNGTAYLDGIAFEDGVVEVDVGPSEGMVFAGVAFRVESPDELELVYLRPFASGKPDAVQYTPRFHGLDAWQLYHGAGYTAAAPIDAGRWTHLKVVFSGRRAEVYVDGAAEPALTVTDLERDPAAGSIGLWGRFGARFADLRYTAGLAGGTPRPAAAIAAEPVPPGELLTHWTISPAFDAETVDEARYPSGLGTRDWQEVESEPSGLVNLARYRAKTGRLSTVYARTVLHAERAERRRLSLGYSDRATIYFRGEPRFTGESTWRSRDPGFLGLVGLDNDYVYLDLEPGDNELLLGVTELFGGWGFVARLDPAVRGEEPEPLDGR
jgi:hypothetical protein